MYESSHFGSRSCLSDYNQHVTRQSMNTLFVINSEFYPVQKRSILVKGTTLHVGFCGRQMTSLLCALTPM